MKIILAQQLRVGCNPANQESSSFLSLVSAVSPVVVYASSYIIHRLGAMERRTIIKQEEKLCKGY